MRCNYERFEQADREGHRYFFEFFDLTSGEFEKIAEWCVERFGISANDTEEELPGSRWFASYAFWELYFRDEADAFEVRMRWC